MDALSSDKILLVFQKEKKTNEDLIGTNNFKMLFKFKPNLKLFVCSQEETLSLIPTIKCPKFKHNCYCFNDADIDYDMDQELSLFTMLLIKYEGATIYEKIRNKIYDFDQEEKFEYYKSDCQIKNWGWKPTIVKNISESQLEDVYSAIQKGLISSNANQFWIKSPFFLSNKINKPIYADTGRLKNILKLLDIGERSSIAFESIWVDYDKMFDFQTELIPNSKTIIFSFGGKLYKIHWSDYKPKLKGLIYEPNNESSVIVVKWDYLNADNVVITYEEDISCFQSDWYDRFPGDDLAPDKLSLHVVLNKSDITSVSFYQIEPMKKIWTFPNLQRIIINAVEEDFKKEEFIDALKYIQKPITLRIEWDEDSWFLTNESFWKMLFKFKAAELEHDDFEIRINWQSQKLNQTNILKSKVIASIGFNEKTIEIGEVINMIRKSFKKYSNFKGKNYNRK